MAKLNWILGTIAAFAIGLSGVANAASLADRHANYGAECTACHADKTPEEGTRVSNEKCLACHESYAKVAERTAKVSPNPHDTHLGNVRCTDCHSGHAQPKLMCNDCHKFDLKTP